MLYRFFLILFFVFFLAYPDADPCFISPITSGYGSTGPYTVIVDSIPHPGLKQSHVYLFMPVQPDSATNTVPAVLFCHGLGAVDPRIYREFLFHIASKGYVAIYSPFKPLSFNPLKTENYTTLLSGFDQAIRHLSGVIDTTRIGIVGHSYGGGAVPATAWWSFTDNSWGANGMFLLILAPYYFFDISQEQLEAFPGHIKLVMQVYQDDGVNDHRMAIDIFENISIPNGEKDFLCVQSDRRYGCTLLADHSIPTGAFDPEGAENALDHYALFRIFDALADYAFTGSAAAKTIALGDGSHQQCFMGVWPDSTPVREMLISDFPDTLPAIRPENAFFNFWGHTMNPRINSVGTDTTAQRKSFFLKSKRLMTWRNYFKAGQYYFKYGRKKMRSLRKGPIEPIKKGFGASGPYRSKLDTFPSPLWQDRDVYIFSPAKVSAPRPAILFCHGYSMSLPYVYMPLIHFINSKGIHIIFSPYRIFAGNTTLDQKYEVLLEGFKAAVRNNTSIIDTTRLGFVGHSFGGGACPAIAWHCINHLGWAKQAACMYLMAPWYFFDIAQHELAAFPSHVNCIMQVFNDDNSIDARIASDLFRNIGIPDARKDFIVVYSDKKSNYLLEADHSTPKGPWDPRGEEDGLDYYGIFRLLDALMAYTFYNDTAAYWVALGNNSPKQRYMGTWPDGSPVKELLSTDRPDTVQFRENVLFRFESRVNPRAQNRMKQE